MAISGYAFITAYLKGEESRMVTSTHMNDITRANGTEEIIEAVRDTDIGGYLETLDIQSFDALDRQLWEYFSGCISRIGWFKNIPQEVKNLLQVYIRKYDVSNIKTALHNIIDNKRTEGIPLGMLYDNGRVEELVTSEDINTVIEICNGCKLQNYASILEGYRLEEGINPAVLTDTKLINEYYRELLNAVKPVREGATIGRILSQTLDLTNLQMVLRTVINGSGTDAAGYIIKGGYLISEELAGDIASGKLPEVSQKLNNGEYRSAVEEIAADYDKNEDISVVDRIIDRLKLKLAGEILAPRIMSPAVVIWYLLLKEIEIRNIRLVLKTAMENISPEEVQEYLVVSP